MSSNQPEPLQSPYDGGDIEVGEDLRSFFISLLQGESLREYHQNRDAYIDRTVRTTRASELLKSEDFIEMERHILAVFHSSRAKPLWVVSPPY